MLPSSRRVRRSGAASSGADPRPLPAYEKPAAPLNAKSLHALQSLSTKNDPAKLKQHLKYANEKLSETVDNINDMVTRQKAVLNRRHAKLAEQGRGSDDHDLEQAEQLEALSRRVESMSADIEAKVRSTIDSQARLVASEKALTEVSSNVVSNQGRTIAAASQGERGPGQLKSRRAGDQDEDEDEEEEEVVDLCVPTLLKIKAEGHEREYGALSMKAR